MSVNYICSCFIKYTIKTYTKK